MRNSHVLEILKEKRGGGGCMEKIAILGGKKTERGDLFNQHPKLQNIMNY